MKRCPQCGTDYQDTFKVCPVDGARLEEETVVLTAPPIPAVRPSDEMVGRTIAGRFRIERKLGEGGMGAVYKAEHVKMNRPCAIKILNSSALNDPEALPRFTREAQMSSRIDHPHAVTIYDYGESEEGLVYLAMEYIEGETLTKVLERDKRFSLERTLEIARQIGEALDAAHALSIVHRDLKPDNIMLSRKGRGGEFVKVLDFGIAKMAEGEDKRFDLTQAGLIIGTPYYMSPEQVSGEKLDPRSDVYSFGLIVYEMLAGDLPFEGQNTQAVMVSRVTMSPKPLRLLRPDVPPPVEAAVMRALARERDLRTPTAADLVAELEAAAAGRWPEGGAAAGATRRQPRPDTVAVHPPPGPLTAGGTEIYRAPETPGPRPPIPPTDPARGVQPPTVAEAWGMPPQQQGYPAAAPGHYPAGAPSQPATKGGAGIWIGLAVALVLLAGLGVGGFLAYRSWTAPAGDRGVAGGVTGTPDAADAAAPDAEALFEEGYRLQQGGDHRAAAEKYRQAIARQGQMTKAYRNLGAALLETGQYQEAQRVLETAVAQDPADAEAQYNLGYASMKLENYPKAAAAFKKATLSDASAHAYAGFALDNAGDDAGATEEYKKFLATGATGDLADMVRAILAGRAEVPSGKDL